VCRDTVDSNRKWTERLRLTFPVLSDESGDLSRELRIMRRVPIGGWSIELMRRTTLLADRGGKIVAVWGDVHIRGHAAAVLETALAV
jgi:thioredoxin-dependent peroxiredoxin